MTDLVSHNLCITCGYATDDAEQYRYHLVQHEGNNRLPSYRPFRCIQRGCTYVAFNPTDYETHVEQYHLLNQMNVMKTYLHPDDPVSD